MAKKESIAQQLKRKLLGDKDTNLYDITGDKIGEIKDGKVIIEGNNITTTIHLDESEDELKIRSK